mgnify:CR=1 FL=1
MENIQFLSKKGATITKLISDNRIRAETVSKSYKKMNRNVKKMEKNADRIAE